MRMKNSYPRNIIKYRGLKRSDGHSYCPKCGIWFGYNYYEHYTKIKYKRLLDDGTEFLELSCINCTYSWTEHTADYREPPVTALIKEPIKELTIEEKANKEVEEICTALKTSNDEKTMVGFKRVKRRIITEITIITTLLLAGCSLWYWVFKWGLS